MPTFFAKPLDKGSVVVYTQCKVSVEMSSNTSKHNPDATVAARSVGPRLPRLVSTLTSDNGRGSTVSRLAGLRAPASDPLVSQDAHPAKAKGGIEYETVVVGEILQGAEFIAAMRASGRASGTLHSYEYALGKFHAWERAQECDEATVTRRDLAAFINHLLNRHPPQAVNNLVGALRVYFRWLSVEGFRLDNPADRLRFLRAQPQPVRSLSLEEVRLLREAAAVRRTWPFLQYRCAVLAIFLVDTGLRIGEALALRPGDVDTKAGSVLVRSTKTRSLRIVPLSNVVRRHIRRYLRRRATYVAAKHEDRQGLLFVSATGDKWQPNCARKAFKSLGRDLGIPDLHPHICRHTFATLSLLNGAPLPAVMALGGWRQLATVQRYTYLTDRQLAEVHARSSPLRKVEER